MKSVFFISQIRLIHCLLLGMLIFVSHTAKADAYNDFILAVRFNDARAVQTQLMQGIDPNSIEVTRGETVMMIALREKSMKVFDVLLKHADIRLDARANNGDTALMIASFMGSMRAVSQLIDAGSAINQPGWTSLHYAAANGNVNVISLLLAHSAYIDAESPNKTTPLMMAVRSGKISAVQIFLDEGADIHVRNNLGLSALDFAIQLEQKEIAECLRSYLLLDQQNSRYP